MAIEIQPPQRIPTRNAAPCFFLAGSADNEQAETWQRAFVEALESSDCVLLNPRRTRWNSRIEQGSPTRSSAGKSGGGWTAKRQPDSF